MKTAAIILTVFWIVSCHEKPKGFVQSAFTQKAQNVILSEAQNGDSNWTLAAKEAEFFEDKQLIDLLNPYLTSNNNNESGTTDFIKALKGRYDIQNNLVVFTDSVDGNSLKEGTEIKTQELFYNTKTKKIWSNVPVTITRGDVIINGSGFKANADFSQMEISDQATVLPKTAAGFTPGKLKKHG